MRAVRLRIWRCRWTLALCRWSAARCIPLCSALCIVLGVTLSAPARAHDLAIDQVLLWPDAAAGELRGELTFDPELTRSKDAQPTPEHARRAVEFLGAHLEVTLDARRVPLRFEVRELWVRGGATLGDVVTFSAPLAASAKELRVHARAFKALIVSVQRVPGRAGSRPGPGPATVETTSWLLRDDDWTPAYRLDTGWTEPGWRQGGPDAFNDANAGSSVAAAAAAGARTPAVEAARGDGADMAVVSWAKLAARFIRLGFEHIVLGGYDHVLFVSGLVLARARRFRQVLVSLSLFTLAHTLTLALGHLQLVQVSPRVVEPLIAFSIFVLGIDNLRASRSVEAPAPARHLVVFSFGLVHGLGFASALSELAFDPRHLVLALFSFNVGVELGQAAVVALLALLLLSLRRWRELESYATLAGSAAIAASGLVLAIDRVAQTHHDTAAATSHPAAWTAASASAASPPLFQNPSRSLDRSL
jgi:hypothetical protein